MVSLLLLLLLLLTRLRWLHCWWGRHVMYLPFVEQWWHGFLGLRRLRSAPVKLSQRGRVLKSLSRLSLWVGKHYRFCLNRWRHVGLLRCLCWLRELQCTFGLWMGLCSLVKSPPLGLQKGCQGKVLLKLSPCRFFPRLSQCLSLWLQPVVRVLVWLGHRDKGLLRSPL